MIKNLKRLLLSMITVSILFSASGCNNIKSDNTDDKSANNQVTLKMVWWGNDSRKAITQKVIDLFEKKNPGIKIVPKSYASTTEVRLNLAINTADEEMPDIINMNLDFIYYFANRKLLEPLNSYADKKLLDLSDVDKYFLEGGIFDNNLYGISLGNNAYCMGVNTSVLNKAGVSIPKNGYTYDEIYEVAKALKSKINDPDFYPFASFVDLNTYLRATGAMQYNSEGNGLGYEDDQVFADYFKLQKKLLDEKLMAPSTIAKVTADRENLLSKGKSAFHFTFTNAIAPISKRANEIIKIISIPSITKDKITSNIRPSMFFSVSSYSKNKNEAVKFIDFFINDIEANNIMMGDRGVPISAKVSEDLFKKVSDAEKEQYLLMDYLKDHPSPVEPPYPQTANNVVSIYSQVSSNILTGKMTPEEGAKEFRTRSSKILSGLKGE